MIICKKSAVGLVVSVAVLVSMMSFASVQVYAAPTARYRPQVLHDSLILHHHLARFRTAMRNHQSEIVRRTLKNIGETLAAETLKHLDTQPNFVETTSGLHAEHTVYSRKPVLFSVLRAGQPLLQGIQRVYPESSVGFIGSARNEKTAVAKSTYMTIPEDMQGNTVILADTMLGTGGTMVDAINRIKKYKPKHILVVCVIAVPQGIKRIQKAFGKLVTVIPASIDHRLDSRFYIVPGAGDAGDVSYGQKLD